MISAPGFRATFNDIDQGQSVSPDYLNKITGSILTRIRGGEGIEIRQTNNQLMISAIGQQPRGYSGGNGGVMLAAQITNVYADTMDCIAFINPGDQYPTPIEVCKPPNLATPKQNPITLINNSILTFGTDSTHQPDFEYVYRTERIDSGPIVNVEVTPMFYIGELIFVKQFFNQTTGEWAWLDINVQGRQFSFNSGNGILPYWVDFTV